MLTQFDALALLAQSRIQTMNQGFRAQNSANLGTAMLMLGGIALVILLAFGIAYLVKLQRAKISDDSTKLFSELCRAHNLSFGQRRWMRQLAKARKLDDPNQLFLNPGLWVLDPGADGKLCQRKARKHLLIAQRVLFNECAA